jgi:hypothetical protein
MVDARGYRKLTTVAAVGLCLMLLAMSIASLASAPWIVVALIVVEGAQAVLIRRAALSYWQVTK